MRSSHILVAFIQLLSQAQAVMPKLRPRDGLCERTSVVILGAGVAGITTAQALHNASFDDFIMIEHREQVGGRAYHTTFGKNGEGQPYTIELGANWIQDINVDSGPENPILMLAEKYNLSNTYSNYSSIWTYDETGYNDYSALIDQQSEASETASDAAGYLLTNNIQDQSGRTGLAVAGWRPAANDMLAQAADWWGWDFEAAYPPDETSLIFNYAGGNVSHDQEDNLVVDQRGFSTIFKGEAYSFLAQDDKRLRLNTTVTNVSYTDDGVTVYNDDGTCVSAAYAVCTFSLGVLQNHVVNFEPELPTWKETAIQSFDMATYTKIFLQFNETFWPEDVQYFLYASPTDRGYYPLFQSLSTLGFLPGSNILFATVTNDHSYRVEAQSDEETQQQVLEVLRQMFPDVTVPEPIAFMYPRWTNTSWSRGSYSNWPVGTTLEMHQNLRANVGRLWFAGEATSSQWFGFLHGAYFSGRDVGQQLAGVLAQNCTNNEGICAGEVHYEVLHGTTTHDEFNAANGWPMNPLESGGARRR